jgi:hypothetical protein
MLADTIDMTLQVVPVLGEEGGEDIRMVLALLAHAAVLHVGSDAGKLGRVLSVAPAGLDGLEDLDGIEDPELAGMTF